MNRLSFVALSFGPGSRESNLRLLASVQRARWVECYGVHTTALISTASLVWPAGAWIETVSELGSLQVKGEQAELAYGGLDKHGNWYEYQFTWLRSLATPVHLARVDAAFRSVEFFSIWPSWLIFWRQSVDPFEVVFSAESPYG
jgi:hypothetical protein